MHKQQKKNKNNMNAASGLTELTVRSPQKKPQTKKKTNFNPVKAVINARIQEIEDNVSKYIIRKGNGGFKEKFINLDSV